MRERIVEAIQGKEFVVDLIERKRKDGIRRALHHQPASNRKQRASCIFSSKKTMTLAQKLYEGMKSGRKVRPVSLPLHEDGFPTHLERGDDRSAARVIQERFGAEYLPATPNVYKTLKAAQEAHEAIRPTSAARDPSLSDNT